MTSDPKLVLSDMTDEPRITWYFPEDDDYGATLGEEIFTPHDLTNSNSEDREHIIATFTAAQTAGVERDNLGYYWPSNNAARAALRAIKAAVKADDGGKWPEWTVKAHAAGWHPPKGWKP